MDFDPIQKLAKRISATKQQRDELNQRIHSDKEEVERLKAKLGELKTGLAEKRRRTEERQVKAARIDKLMAESDKALRKIIETSITLERALVNEPGNTVSADE